MTTVYGGEIRLCGTQILQNPYVSVSDELETLTLIVLFDAKYSRSVNVTLETKLR